MRCVSFCVMAVLSAFTFAGTAHAGGEAKPRPVARSSMFAPVAAVHAKRMSDQQRQERRFLKEAAAGSRFEAEASRMALGKSNDPGVRSFAATLINHHASAGNELLYMLHSRGMAAPMLGNDQRKILNRLAKLQGAKFDREFLEQVALRYQQDDIHDYERASLVTREPRLKAWIDRTLPTLRYHLTTAQRMAPDNVKLAKAPAAVSRPTAGNRFVSRAKMTTQSMGAGPAPAAEMQLGGMQLRGMQFGGPAQLGVTRPVAARPSESSTR